jgi:hypothetical protein
VTVRVAIEAEGLGQLVDYLTGCTADATRCKVLADRVYIQIAVYTLFILGCDIAVCWCHSVFSIELKRLDACGFVGGVLRLLAGYSSFVDCDGSKVAAPVDHFHLSVT